MNDTIVTKQNQTWTLAKTLEQDCYDQAFLWTRHQQVHLMTVLITKRKYVIIIVTNYSLTKTVHMSIGVLFNLFMKIFLLLDNLSTNDIF